MAFCHWGSVAAIFNFVIQRTLRRSFSDKFLFDTCWSTVNFCGLCICYDTWQWNDTFSFVRRTAKEVDALPYHFRESFEDDVLHSRLYIDVDSGVIGYISTYNPFQIQIFNASRIDQIKTVASPMFGIRFVFYIDGKKVKMYTLMEEHIVNLNSAEGKEAVEEADKYVACLQNAKWAAEQRRR